MGLRATILFVIAVALMVVNHELENVAHVRAQLSVVVLPLQVIIDKPIQFFRWLGTSISTQQEVLGENARLRARQMLLQAKLQRLLALERENAQLRELLSSSSHLPGKTLVAQLLAVDADPLSQQIILDKGEHDGVFIGQPVLDAFGIMGQVINTTSSTSQVMLVTDSQSAIPVQDNRNGVRAIAGGTGYSDQLALLNVPITGDIMVGDVLETSGLGGRFPFGYPVGQVVSIERRTGARFAKVIVRPSAHVDKSRQVMLLWPELATQEPVMIPLKANPDKNPPPPKANKKSKKGATS